MHKPAFTPNRRSFISGAGVVAVAAAVPAVYLVATPSRTAWDAAVSNLDRAEDALEATHDAYNRAETLYWQLQPKRPTINDLFTLAGSVGDVHVRAAALKEEYERLDELAQHQSGYAAIDKMRDGMIDRIDEATAALLSCPAPDLAALTHKANLIKSDRLDHDNLKPVLADLLRLMGEI